MRQEAKYPVSRAQREVLLAMMSIGHNATYHLADHFDIRGPLDISLLEQAIKAQFAAVDVMRACFIQQDDTFIEHVRPPACAAEWQLKVHDVSQSRSPEQDFRALVDAMLKTEFDIERDLLVRFAVVRMSEHHHRLIKLESHLLVDGVGHALLARRIIKHYNLTVRGVAPTDALPKLPPLRRVHEQEQAYCQSEQYLKDRAYWQAYCQDWPEPERLSRTEAEQGMLVRCFRQMPEALAIQVREVAKRKRMRLPTMLMALSCAYLYRMTGQSDQAIGMPVPARNAKCLRQVPSMVANILPLRITFDANDCIEDVARRLSGRLRRHLVHQRYRFEDMARDQHQVRGHRPFFKTVINMIANDERDQFEGCETHVRSEAIGPAANLLFDILDRNLDGRLEMVFHANAAVYSAEELDLHMQRFIQLLEAFVAAPEAPITSFELLTPEERARVYPMPSSAGVAPTFDQAFRDVVSQYDDHNALEGAEDAMTFAALDDAAERLAQHLTRMGITTGQRVAVMLPREPTWVITLVALFKMGATYMPIDAELPAERIAYMIDDAQPALVITDRAGQTQRGLVKATTLRLDSNALAALAPLRTRRKRPTAAPNDDAYLIYTSGSTGRPKGVRISHRSIVPIARDIGRGIDAGPATRMLQSISPSFDMSILEIMVSLLSGATLVQVDRSDTTPGERLATALKQQRINTIVMTPSVAACLPGRDVAPGTVLLLGGEVCPKALLRRFAHCRCVNIYGPSETSFTTTMNTDYSERNRTIGVPVSDTRLYVMDRQGELLPPGARGELVIAGPAVANGYLHRPELTAERFVPDVLDATQTMYRSGDQVFFDHQGGIHYLGRQDSQIKLRGLRIELDEINAALRDCNGVDDAVSMVGDLPPHGEAIIGYIVTSQPLDTYEVKRQLARQLPHYMVPSHIVMLSVFPLTPNGKLDLCALPFPEVTDLATLEAHDNTPDEALVCALFEDLLSCGQVHVDQDFFELGGNSLVGMQLLRKLDERIGFSLTLADLLGHASPRLLAERLAYRRKGAGNDASQVGPHSKAAYDMLFTLREGDACPLFCIHPAGGLGWSYAGLLPHIPEGMPVYAIQSRSLIERDYRAASVQHLVAEYAELITSTHPGPYRLLGWSLGGLLAHQIATYLQAQGSEVAFLGVLDAYPRVNADFFSENKEEYIREVAHAILNKPFDEVENFSEALSTALFEQVIDDVVFERVLDGFIEAPFLMKQCRYSVFDGKLCFIRASVIPTHMGFEVQGAPQAEEWQPFIRGDIHKYEVAVPHYYLMLRDVCDQYGDFLGRTISDTLH